MTEIKFDKRNYRKHGEKNKNLINKSLVECGAGRSILIDNNNEIIAGNGVYEQAQALGIKTRVVETQGDELVVVKRLDINSDDEKRKKLAVLDNSTSDSSEFDMELLASDFDNIDLADSGTYVKSFYSVIFAPSCVSIAMMGDKHKRIHHNISWDNCVPKILNEKYKIK